MAQARRCSFVLITHRNAIERGEADDEWGWISEVPVTMSP